MNRKIYTGIWRLAAPKFSITSLSSMVIGGAIAARDHAIAWEWHGIFLLVLFCFEVAKNAWGDIYDFDSGNDLAVAPEDRTPFSGGRRVLVDKLLSRNQTWVIAYVFGLSGFVIGTFIVFFQEPTVVWIGIVGLFLCWSYHGPPLQLVYRGFGELAVVVAYGPVIALSTYLIQTHSYSMEVFWLSLVLGILIGAFLWVNEFPDYHADVSANKKNLVVRLGRYSASRVLPVIYLSGFVLLAIIPFVTTLPKLVWSGFLAVPFALCVCIWTWQQPDSFYRSKPVNPFALLTFVLFTIGAGAGIVVG